MVSCTYNTETLKDLTFVSNEGYTKDFHYTVSQFLWLILLILGTKQTWFTSEQYL